MNPASYVALVGTEYVESADTLDALLAALAENHDPTVNEDVAVWHCGRIVLVVHPDNSWTWLQPGPATVFAVVA